MNAPVSSLRWFWLAALAVVCLLTLSAIAVLQPIIAAAAKEDAAKREAFLRREAALRTLPEDLSDHITLRYSGVFSTDFEIRNESQFTLWDANLSLRWEGQDGQHHDLERRSSAWRPGEIVKFNVPSRQDPKPKSEIGCQIRGTLRGEYDTSRDIQFDATWSAR
jgi:hypothetical protein